MLKKIKIVPRKGKIVPKKGTSHSQEPLTASLFTKTRRAILFLFFSRPDESFYMRQILKIVNAGSGVVQREIEKLTSSGILTREKRGNQVHLSANKDCPIYDELQGLVVKTFGVADQLKASLESIRENIKLAFIYNNFANDNRHHISDVEMTVVGKVSFVDIASAVLPAQEKLRREVIPTVYSTKEYMEKFYDKRHLFIDANEHGREKIYLIGTDEELLLQVGKKGKKGFHSGKL